MSRAGGFRRAHLGSEKWLECSALGDGVGSFGIFDANGLAGCFRCRCAMGHQADLNFGDMQEEPNRISIVIKIWGKVQPRWK